jgi:hypothetical protein
MRCKNPRPYYSDGIWNCKNCNSIQCALIETFEDVFFTKDEKIEEPLTSCECGSDKTYGINNAHSHWCKKAKY